MLALSRAVVTSKNKQQVCKKVKSDYVETDEAIHMHLVQSNVNVLDPRTNL